jgi:cyclase
MLKTRVIPTLLYRDTGLVKGTRFDSWRPIGAAMQAIKVYEMRGVDELIFVDIRATLEGRPPDYQLIDDLADDCFMPLTVGGGLRTIDEVGKLLRVGADKVCIGTATIEGPELIDQVASRYGSQCAVVSIDVRRTEAGCRVVVRSGTAETTRDPVEVAIEAARRGAGELLLTSVDRDGTMTGYDVPLVRAVSEAVSIPVIAAGGAGTYEHMAEVILAGKASAVAAAAMFHFTQQTPLEAKRYLASRGIPVRL